MAEKMAMIIVLVDLDCRKCYNKMRKILCQLQDCERIQSISFDDKSKTITIIGPFDPQRLSCKLRCKGGKVIKDIHIVDSVGGGKPPQDMGDPPSAPAPAKNGKNKNKEKPPPAERPPSPPPPAPTTPPPEMMRPPSPAHHPAPPDREMSAMVPQPQYVEDKPAHARPSELDPPMSPPPKERPVEQHPPLPPPPVKQRPMRPPILVPACPARPSEQPVEYVVPNPTVEIPSWPAPPVGPCGCPCCAPCYQGYYEGCRCACGRVCSYAVSVHPLPAPAGCGAYRGCRTFSDDDPSACTIM